jgi:hypothetical protein
VTYNPGVNRREFLSAALVAGLHARLRGSQSLTADGWRIFEVTTHVHVQNPSGITRAWLPTPLVGAPYQRTLGDTYHADGGAVLMVETEELDLLYAEWPAGIDPIVTLTSRVATREHEVDLSSRRDSADVEQVRAIYDHVASESAGETKDASPNRLLVALASAAGLRARVVQGLRLSSQDATRAQHCRAEVFVANQSWLPIDAADRVFGSWDGRWIGFNAARDVKLPRAVGGPVGSFTRPQAETANGRADSLDPDIFRYNISVREIS